MAKKVLNFQKTAIFAVVTCAMVAFVACNKSKIIPENPVQEKETENYTAQKPSQNASWTGWANAGVLCSCSRCGFHIFGACTGICGGQIYFFAIHF